MKFCKDLITSNGSINFFLNLIAIVYLIIENYFLEHSGLLLHTRGGITGKRERESEHDGLGEEDPASCSIHKMQRQSTEVSGQHIPTHHLYYLLK